MSPSRLIKAADANVTSCRFASLRRIIAVMNAQIEIGCEARSPLKTKDRRRDVGGR